MHFPSTKSVQCFYWLIHIFKCIDISCDITNPLACKYGRPCHCWSVSYILVKILYSRILSVTNCTSNLMQMFIEGRHEKHKNSIELFLSVYLDCT